MHSFVGDHCVQENVVRPHGNLVNDLTLERKADFVYHGRRPAQKPVGSIPLAVPQATASAVERYARNDEQVNLRDIYPAI